MQVSVKHFGVWQHRAIPNFGTKDKDSQIVTTSTQPNLPLTKIELDTKLSLHHPHLTHPTIVKTQRNSTQLKATPI